MDCRDLNEHIELYVDGELAASERTEVEAHCAACSACNETLRTRREFKRKLRGLAATTTMPPDVRARLRAAVHSAQVPSAPARSRASRPAMTSISAFAAVTVLSIGAPWHLTNGAPQEASSVAAMESDAVPPLVTQAGQWFQREVPVEVIGPDPAQVGRWFSGKVDFAVTIPDLGRRGTLLGGRLGNFDDQLTAMLVYELEGAKVNVMAVNAAQLDSGFGAQPRSWTSADGYSVAVQNRSGVAYAFTAAMPETELVGLLERSFVAR
jgi:anti-sigma factor (TIGR02949 family)